MGNLDRGILPATFFEGKVRQPSSMGCIARDMASQMERLIELGERDGLLRIVGCTLRMLRGVVMFTHMSRVENGS